jgi:Sensors of blue-light using FAD
MLVFCGNQFLQVLEGNAADVVRTYDRIATDPSGYSHIGKTLTSSAMGFSSMALDNVLPPGFARENGPGAFRPFRPIAGSRLPRGLS